jgi:septal ring factor EnvC (AmiA/AmiB activator)
MSENPNAPLYSTLQKSVTTILQSIVIALLIWVGTSINANNEKIVSIQKDVEAIQRNQAEQYNQIQKMVTKEVFDMNLKNLETKISNIEERVTKLEK